MPELPEVQTVLDALLPHVLHREISGVTILWPGVIECPAPADFRARLGGQRLVDANRRGKYMIFQLSEGDWLLMHLRMTGEMRITPRGGADHPHDRLIFHLSDQNDWRFKDQRKFGRAYLVPDPQEILWKLGPEALDDSFSPHYLADRLRGRKAPIKSLLLDQRLVAGIGNIYADEALYEARIHPLRPGGSLSKHECHDLTGTVKDVMQHALSQMGTTFSTYRRPDGSLGEFQNHLQVFQRTGEPCPSCGTAIEKIVVGGRSTHFCPKEQT